MTTSFQQDGWCPRVRHALNRKVRVSLVVGHAHLRICHPNPKVLGAVLFAVLQRRSWTSSGVSAWNSLTSQGVGSSGKVSGMGSQSSVKNQWASVSAISL
jgi:hypothetical protein